MTTTQELVVLQQPVVVYIVGKLPALFVPSSVALHKLATMIAIADEVSSHQMCDFE